MNIYSGWPSLVFCLKREGFYSSFCSSANFTKINGTDFETCIEQEIGLYSFQNLIKDFLIFEYTFRPIKDEQLSFAFSLATSLSRFAVLPFSLFLYKFELFFSRILCSSLMTIGLIFMCFYEQENIFIIGFILLASQCNCTFALNMAWDLILIFI